MSDPISTNSFVVTEALSEVYYKGLPSYPPLIATTKPAPFEHPIGPEVYGIRKELRCLGDHQLAKIWDSGVAPQLCSSLTRMGVNWSSLDAVRIANVEEPSGPAIVWIGVEIGSLSFEKGSEVANSCHSLIASHGVKDYYVEIRESEVVRQGGNRFLDPVLVSDPTLTARDPYTATLGIPISTKNRPWIEGTGGFYLSAGGNDKNIYLVTARHIVLPIDKDDNNEYYHQNNSLPGEEVIVMVLGTSTFNDKLAAIDAEIRSQESDITDAKERIESVLGMEDHQSVREDQSAGRDLEVAEKGVEALMTFRHQIATHWMAMEDRVIGKLIWAPPIIYSTEPGDYTLDLAIIKIDPGRLDTNNYRGNTINIGKRYSRQEFLDKFDPLNKNATSFKFPPSRLVKLEDQVPESALIKSGTRLDTNDDLPLVVFKNSAITGTTIGTANNVSSYTRSLFAGHYYESREWPVISNNKYPGGFSMKGDSGSCVADSYSRIGGLLTGGSGANNLFDITYVTPISFIMKVLQNTKGFKQAHLNPVLT